MIQQDAEFWTKITTARQELKNQYEANPAVTMIDIGYAPASCKAHDQVVLRVHVAEGLSAEQQKVAAFPSDMNGIPVCVMQGASHAKP
ncbi:MAG TPA: hypothetical protein PKE45_24590 [Caldilineaceae bacterium]|nr:hypothetical protein [Caldilineaceae bacterium]